jgi:hypothetical protein
MPELRKRLQASINSTIAFTQEDMKQAIQEENRQQVEAKRAAKS